MEARDYLCSGRLGEKAVVVCVTRSCENFAFCCLNDDCDCSCRHRGHQIAVLHRLLRPAWMMRVPSDLRDSATKIDNELASIISRVTNLQQKHRAHQELHYEKYIENLFGDMTAYKRLQGKQQLENHQMTGNAFFQLQLQINRRIENSTIGRFYTVQKEQLQAELKRSHEDILGSLSRIQRLWNNFTFSNTLKDQNVRLINPNGACIDPGRYGLVLLEPNLPPGGISTINIKIAVLGDNLRLGVVYLNLIGKAGVKLAGHTQGVYMQDAKGNQQYHDIPPGFMIHRTNMRFLQHDTITISMNRNSGKLTFACQRGGGSQMQTKIHLAPEQPIRFCAWLLNGTELHLS